ncbi:hypothetical protein OL548_03360 [Lysinibacillus sp. MHQ-1]|nr:hypothetical protein OL548_03360 [Lysinibacillus sp. MHQ-1]
MGLFLFFGKTYEKHEKEIKERIGFVYDENIFYENITLKDMKRIIKPAYKRWDDEAFQHYVEQFELPLNKKYEDLFERDENESIISHRVSTSR